MNTEFILEQTAQGEIAQKIKNLVVTLDFDTKSIRLKGVQVIKTITGREELKVLGLELSYNAPIEYPGAVDLALAADPVKESERATLADCCFEAFKEDIQDWIKGVFKIETK